MSDSTLPVGLGQRPKASPPARTWTVILGIVLLSLIHISEPTRPY